MKLRLLLIPLLFYCSLGFSMMHVGGELTWECLANGNYRFTLIHYQKCGSGCGFGPQSWIHSNAPGYASITLDRVLEEEFSPDCYLNPNPISCATATSATLGAFKRHVYTSDQSYPAGIPLSGTPPQSGWIFYYNSCCNIPVSNISSNSANGMTIIAKMYPYQNNSANNCFDNSPAFEEKPVPVFCADYPISFSNAAYDKDLDSLSYKWDQIYSLLNTPITTYYTGYDYDDPFGVPTYLDSVTGHVNIPDVNNFQWGRYQYAITVESWRKGVLVSEISRIYFMEATNCDSLNSPPFIAAPFDGPAGPSTSWIDTIFAGGLLNFSVSVTDFDLLPNTNPQTITLEAFSTQFDSLSMASGPVAIINPSQTQSGSSGLMQTVSWQTGCQHIQEGNLPHQEYFNFLFHAQDDYCPVPGYSQETVTILIKDKPLIPSPDQVYAIYDTISKDITLNWKQVTDNMNSFDRYEIWWTYDLSAPFLLLDSLFSISDTSYTQYNAGTDDTLYFFVVSRSGCFGDRYAVATDTIAVELLNTSSVKEQIKDLAILNIFPNPAKGYCQIELSEKIESVSVFNQTGQLIQKDEGFEYKSKLTLDLSSEKTGIYIIIVKDVNGNLYSRKLNLI